MSPSGADIEVSVWRSGAPEVGSEDGAGGAFETFRVPAHDSQTILDVVTWIQQNQDPTLAYRYACRVGMCGSCAMMVNGVPRWTCRTHVNKVLEGTRLEVAPLRNLPVIKDLATDMDPFFERWTDAGGVHQPTRSRDDAIEQIDPQSAGRVVASEGGECINCAVCYAGCDTVAGNADYLGPAALQRAWVGYNDSKNAGYQTLPAAVIGAGGCHNCHSQGSCTQHCPNELDPMQAIAGLKRASLLSLFKGRG